MKGFISVVVILVVFLFGVVSCSEIIDPAKYGIVVKKIGDNKGVQDEVMQPGFNLINPLTTTIHEWPSNLQQKTWSREQIDEQHPKGQALVVTTKGGMQFPIDVSLQYTVSPINGPKVFRKYRLDLPELENTRLRTDVQRVFSDVGPLYSPDSLLRNLSRFSIEASRRLNKEISQDGFTVDPSTSITVTHVELPDGYRRVVDEKMKVEQEAQKKQAELALSEIAAKKKRIDAEGDAAKIRIAADAQAYKNAKEQQSLTPLYLQMQAIQKWDGRYPQTVAGGNLPLIKSF